MRISFRLRILLTLVPLLALLAGLGTAATLLIHHIGGRIDAILRENYDSVRYMQELREALEKIDTCFQLALAGQKDELARKEYASSWTTLDHCISLELGNITLPGEREAATTLRDRAKIYRRQGEGWWKLPPHSDVRRDAYFENGLKADYETIRDRSHDILTMNQRNMEQSEQDARRTAHTSLFGFGIGLVIVSVLALWLAWNTMRATLRPIQAVTQSALAIGAGNLDQVVPVLSPDELGQLAGAFNTMARQLREYRQAGHAQLLRAQQTSQATINSFTDPVLVVDAAGNVEMANPAAQRLIGAGPTAWQQPGDLSPRLQDAIRTQRPYLPEGFDCAIRLVVAGQEAFYLPRIFPIATPENAAIGAAILLQDVTRFRLLDQVKSDLVATVSHELKTPLTSIRLALHLLLEEVIGPLTAKQTELLLDARDNGERLLRMVNNLLDLARLEKGTTLDLHPERPITLIGSALEVLAPRAADKGVELVVEVSEDLPEVAADAERLGHALGNVLDNALTYTPAGGKITVSATASAGEVTLAVADTGVGIEPEHLPHIFDKFYRIPGHTSETGTGLGLAIVREVVTAHGGRVSCDSTPGEGSVFRIVLPCTREGST